MKKNHNKPPITVPSTPAQAGAGTPFFGQLLLGVSRQWRRVLDVHLAQLGLTDATWVPLFHMHAAGASITLKELAHRVGLESSTLVRVVDLLEARGLLVRTTDANDRRSKRLTLTDAGHATVAEVRAALQHIEAQLLEGMDPQAVASLQAGMALLQQRLGEAQALLLTESSALSLAPALVEPTASVAPAAPAVPAARSKGAV